MHRFSGSFQGKKWEKREAKSAARKWREEEKGFWGSINSVFWQIMSYSFWWICNLPLPMSCCDHSIYIRTVKPKLFFNFCTFDSFRHTDLNDAIVSKKSLLHQNELYLNKKGLEFIVRYSSSPFLSAFYDLDTFSCFFCPFYSQKPKNHQKYWLIFADFFPILWTTTLDYPIDIH